MSSQQPPDDEFNPYAGAGDEAQPNFNELPQISHDLVSGEYDRDALLAAEVEENDQDADLAGMYAKGKSLKERPRLTINEGALPEEKKSLTWLWVLVAILFVIGGIAGVLFGVKRELVDDYGVAEDVPLIKWLLAQSSMNEHQRLMQRMDFTERGNYLTYLRMEMVYAAALEYSGSNGGRPRSAEDLVAAGLLEEEDSTDGFGNPYTLQGDRGGIEVIAPGEDGVPRTDDDFRYDGRRLETPPAFEQYKMDHPDLF